MKRRKFLGISLATSTLVITGTLAYANKDAFLDQAEKKLKSLRELEQSPPGSIDQEVSDILVTSAVAILGIEALDLNRYKKFFQWHAENAPGYKAIYENFASSVKQKAQDIGQDFNSAERSTQLEIIDRHRTTPNTMLPDKAQKATSTIFERENVLFENFILNNIVAYFARTDALKAMGYDSFMGVPRGLENYQLAPSFQS